MVIYSFSTRVICVVPKNVVILHMNLFQGVDPNSFLRTHIQGIINHGCRVFKCHVDINEYSHDSNLVLNILLKAIHETQTKVCYDNKLIHIYKDGVFKYLLIGKKWILLFKYTRIECVGVEEVDYIPNIIDNQIEYLFRYKFFFSFFSLELYQMFFIYKLTIVREKIRTNMFYHSANYLWDTVYFKR